VPLSLVVARERSRHYRAQLYVNGWMVGIYVSDLGPQQAFPVPPGVLRTAGRNSLAVAVINSDARTGGLGRITLRATGNHAVPPALWAGRSA
jgi:beta-galactosidase